MSNCHVNRRIKKIFRFWIWYKVTYLYSCHKANRLFQHRMIHAIGSPLSSHRLPCKLYECDYDQIDIATFKLTLPTFKQIQTYPNKVHFPCRINHFCSFPDFDHPQWSLRRRYRELWGGKKQLSFMFFGFYYILPIWYTCICDPLCVFTYSLGLDFESNISVITIG